MSLDILRKSVASGSVGDAFGRLRVANTGQRLDVEFLYDKQVDLFDETTNNGTVAHNANTRDLTLSLSDANNGSFAKMESYPIPYTAGNSQLIDMTGVLDLADIGTGTAEVFIRTSISGTAAETTIAQSAWINLTSGVDWSQSHIFQMDFQSLKVGTIRFGLVQNGGFVQVAQINNDNVRDSGYWQLPNLPAYYHLYTTGGETFMEIGYGNDANAIGFRYKITANASATMKAICCSVKSEGGRDLADLPGLPRCTSTGVTEVTASTTLIPIISVRSKSTLNSLENMILSIFKSVNVTTTNPIRVAVINGGALTNASWSSVGATSSMEADVSATAITGGTETITFYVADGAGASLGNASAPLGRDFLWYRQGSQTGILTIAAIKTGTTDASVLASINWEEIR